jgi:integrase
MFLLHSGLRVGEALEMRWSDITFDIDIGTDDGCIAQVRVSKDTKKRTGTFSAGSDGCKSCTKGMA